MRILFAVRCDLCSRNLETADGLHFHHLNDADCSGGDAELPAVTVEQVAKLFTAKKPRKAAPKKVAKKK